MSQNSPANKTICIQVNQTEAGLTYLGSEDENIIESLDKQGIQVRKACDNGVCGVCLTRLFEGEVDYGLREPFGLNQKELEQGYILPCIAHCKTDIEIETPPAPKPKRTRP